MNLGEGEVEVEGLAGTVLVGTDRARDGEAVDGRAAAGARRGRRGGARVTVEGLDELLSDEGWPYASAPPVEPGDPGRFHALFGRDSLITSLQVLPERPDVARATLRALARLQGREEDPATLEEPGKIGHEFRDAAPESFVASGWPAEGPFAYYGTADATSWFLVLLAATGDGALADELAGAWRAAGAWLEGALERGGGFVRFAAGTSGGLSQQGWRDAIDPVSAQDHGGILRADGTAPGVPARRRRHPGGGARGPARARRGCRARTAGSGSPRSCASASARSGRTRWPSSPTARSCPARAPSSAGCCGRTRSTAPRARRPPRGCASPTC